ncbi:chromate transporter, partial [Acinetobacter baumannii]
ILSWIYASYGQISIVQALFFGLKAAVLAVVLEAVMRVGRRALKNKVMVIVAILSFIGIFIFALPFPFIILVAALIGYIGNKSGSK